MDFIKKAGASLGGNTNQQAPADGSAPVGGAPAGEQKQDYGDKAFDFISKKSGHDMAPGTDEKVTDGARGLYEKATGSKVDQKYSN